MLKIPISLCRLHVPADIARDEEPGPVRDHLPLHQEDQPDRGQHHGDPAGEDAAAPPPDGGQRGAGVLLQSKGRHTYINSGHHICV